MVMKTSASSASVSVFIGSEVSDQRSVVVVADPSPFSPSFPFCFLSTAAPSSVNLLDPSLLPSVQERDMVRYLHCIRSDARHILVVGSFLLARRQTFSNLAFILFSATLSGSNHHYALYFN
jgi:hypothetical protein